MTARVMVTAADAGAAVTGLSADDFELWSDGAPVQIKKLSSEPDDLSVLLLIDASASALETWDLSADSLSAYIPPIDSGLVANLSPRDHLGLGVFGRQIRFGREFGRDLASLAPVERDVLRMDGRDRIGPSPIWDAVDAATDLLAVRPGQRAIILMTDGRATGNRKSFATVVDHAVRADVAVVVLARGVYFMPPDITANAPSANLRALTVSTGGVFFGGGSPGSLFARALNQLHHTYMIGFTPSPEAGVHRLQVRVNRTGVQAHVRSQYWTERIP